MKMTKQDVARQFDITINNVKQVESKQLFIIDDYSSLHNNCSNCKYLVSYNTIIGIYDYNNFTWYITNEKFSPTTSKQTTQFINRIANKVVRVDSEIFAGIKLAIRQGLPVSIEL